MAEGERMEWPEVTLYRHSTEPTPVSIARKTVPPNGGTLERYVPASHFTQLLEGLEAEIQSRRSRASELRADARASETKEAHDLLTWDADELDEGTDRLQKLIDQHKKEGRS